MLEADLEPGWGHDLLKASEATADEGRALNCRWSEEGRAVPSACTQRRAVQDAANWGSLALEGNSNDSGLKSYNWEKKFKRVLWVLRTYKEKKIPFFKEKMNLLCNLGLSGELCHPKAVTGWMGPLTLRSPGIMVSRGQSEMCFCLAACGAQKWHWARAGGQGLPLRGRKHGPRGQARSALGLSLAVCKMRD